jgi:hypothetical protein
MCPVAILVQSSSQQQSPVPLQVAAVMAPKAKVKSQSGGAKAIKKEALLSKELHALQAESTNRDIAQILKDSPQHALAVFRYLKTLTDGAGLVEQDPLDQDKFPACYNKMQQLPKTWVVQVLQQMSNKFDLSTLHQIIALDKDVIYKLFFFGIGMERDAKLVSKNKLQCSEKCLDRHSLLGSPLNNIVFQEIKATKIHLQPDWSQCGVFTLLPPMLPSVDMKEHKFTEVVEVYTMTKCNLPEHTSFDGTWCVERNWSRAQAVLVKPDNVTEVKVCSLFPPLPAGDILAQVTTPAREPAEEDGLTGDKLGAVKPAEEDDSKALEGESAEPNAKRTRKVVKAPEIPASLGGSGGLVC